ncbi:MAG: Gfo/Idh/MocA family protein [Alkalispirochaetaceae bacterium]
MKQYRVGVLGFGFIGKVHAYAVRNLPLFYDLPFSATVTHVATSSEKSAMKAKEQLEQIFGAPIHASVGFEGLLEDDALDAIAVCTPNHLHVEPIVAALAAGKAVYCDKPLADTLKSAEEIAAVASENRAANRLGMVFQNRFFPATMEAKRIISSGAVGRLLAFRGSYLHSGNASPEVPLKWKLDASYGGGVIADLGSHLIDLLIWLIGPVRRVYNRNQIAYAERPAREERGKRVTVTGEDAFYSLATLSGTLGEEVEGTLEASKLATGTEDELRFEIHGSEGAVRFNSMQPNFLEVYGRLPGTETGGWSRLDTVARYGAPASGFPGPKNATGWLRAHVANFAEFLAAIDEKRAPEPGLAAALAVQQVMEALRESAREDSPVTLP